MDFIYCSGAAEEEVEEIELTYDVICQWKKKLWDVRMPKMPDSIRISRGKVRLLLGVPKFHLVVHEKPCHAPHSLGFTKGSGETDGESIERNWAETNGAAASTKEMGPGSRHDTLDDLCGHSNWMKTVGLSKSFSSFYARSCLMSVIDTLLRRRLEFALDEGPDHIDMYGEFTASIESQANGQTRQWHRLVMDWELEDKEGKSPYDTEGEGTFGLVLIYVHLLNRSTYGVEVTMATVTRRFEEEEYHLQRQNDTAVPRGRAAFLLEGIAIQREQ